MPDSQQPIEARDLIIDRILSGPHDAVVDVGAGTGRMGRLLRGKVGKLSGIEVWPQAVMQNHLDQVYDKVIIADARDCDHWEKYDAVIMCDMLEHIPRADADSLVDRLRASKTPVYLSVPISPCPQDGAIYKNPFETHHDQWNHEELTARGWKLLHRGMNEDGTVEIGTYCLNESIDLRGSFSAADAFPVKLLQNKGCIDDCGNILPVHVQLIPTNACDLKCAFCSCTNRRRGEAIPWPEMMELLARMKESGTQSVTITGGGEPCLYPKINELIEDCCRLGIKSGVVSNGSPASIPRLEAVGATWIRISFSDDRVVDPLFVSRIEDAVRRIPSHWAFSYVITEWPNLESIKGILALAHRLCFTHVRLVADILQPDIVPDFDGLRRNLRGSPGEGLVIYQDRKVFTKGTGRCLISLLKPVIDADGNVYPCCGVQYALPNPNLQMEAAMRMGHWRDFLGGQGNGRCFDGSICVKCYYSDYNSALEMMTRRIIHREFV